MEEAKTAFKRRYVEMLAENKAVKEADGKEE